MDIFLWMNYSFLKSDVFDLWLASAFRKDDFPKNPRFVDKFFFIRVYIHWHSLRKVVEYIPDLSETFRVTLCNGTIWLRDQEKFRRKYPDPTAADLLVGIEKEEIFFVLDPQVSGDVSSSTHSFGGNRYDAERYVDVTNERYALVRKVVQNHAWIALIGTGGMIVSAVTGLCLYGKKRVAI